MTSTPRIYWDACVFIVLIDMEKRAPKILDGINELIDKVESGEAALVTSTITRIEVTKTKLEPKKEKRFIDLLARRNIIERNVDIRVADIAREIRHTYCGDDGDPKVMTADAVHAATAIASEVDQMWTLDGSGQRRRPGDLLALPSPICGKWEIEIVEPYTIQGKLFRLPPAPEDEDSANEES